MLFLDIETRSPLKLQKVGTYAYAEQAEILLLAYAIGNRPVQVWDLTIDKIMPVELERAFSDPTVCCIAHNSSFERVCLKLCLGVDIPIHRWKCTMVASRIAGLPAKLDAVCQVLKLPEEYSKMAVEGKQLIRRYCYGELGLVKKDDFWGLFKSYCLKDVEACREVFRRLPPVLKSEMSLWVLDQIINDRGYQIDLTLANNADKYVKTANRQLDVETRELTDGQVCSSRCVSALLEWLSENEQVVLADLKESTIEDILSNSTLSQRAICVLRNRSEASRSAPRKYQALIDAVSSDGRLRGTLQFYGASRTGRWAGRVFQPQNLPRPRSSDKEIEQAIEDFTALNPIENPIKLASDCIRSTIVSSQGKKLIVADLAGIEARVLAWIAGEQWKLDAFERGDDIYKLAYAKAFNIPYETVSKSQRSIGKVMELALGYQGGAKAFLSMASTVGLDLQQMAEQVKATASIDDWEQAENTAMWMRENHPKNSIDNFLIGTACELLKGAWRKKHPNVVSLWERMQKDFREILSCEPNVVLSINSLLKLRMVNGSIQLKLPASRHLSYVDVRETNGELSYLSTIQAGFREKTYGGKLVENVVQAISRDILVSGMWNASLMGYDIVLSVHDEIVSETPDNAEYTAEELCSLMAEVPFWANGLPLKAEGYEALRYRK